MLKDIRHFLALSDLLLTGGMPTAAQLEAAAKEGIEVVINLALHDIPNTLPEEQRLVESLGMTYINIPVPWNHPTRQQFDEFADALDAHSGRKILVHCEANYRATAFPTLYRILRLGWPPDEALEVMHRVWHEEKYPIWERFIRDNISTDPPG